jgi:O-methyltransferase involved in polyketide biosynthesis
MQAANYSKISITAKLVAYARQFSDIQFAQDVAIYINAEQAVEEIASRLQDDDARKFQDARAENSIYAPILEARYKSIVELIKQTGIKQVLELASGFSLRGLSMSQSPDISYVETDLAELNEEKIPLITALREKYGLRDVGNYHVITANALDRTEVETAAKVLDRSHPLVVVAEGLIPYLSSAEQAILADNVRNLISGFNGGAWITPDFTTKQTESAVTGTFRTFREAINKTTDRNLHEGAFDSEEALDAFINKHGFTSMCSYQTDLVQSLVSVDRLGIDQELLERLKPRMRVWLMTSGNLATRPLNWHTASL